LNAFWQSFNIPSMAIGAFFAVLLHAKNRLLKWFLNTPLFYFSLGLTCLLLYQGVYFPHITVHDIPFPYLYKEFYSIGFGIIILNFAANKGILISLEAAPFRYLGKISYGLYIYHPLAIVAALHVTRWLGGGSNMLIFIISFALTVLLAGTSYKYFESFFLNYKPKFTKVTSGDEPS